MSNLGEVGDRDAWRCWLCDEPVDPDARKGGREVVARCPSRADADQAAAWLVDRLSRLAPGLAVTTQVEAGGGQFLLVLRTV